MSTNWTRALQVALSAVAGFVDAIGFQVLGGIYVAFMSGSSTLLGMGFGNGILAPVGLPAAMVGCFVLGVMLGTLLGGLMRRRRAAGVMMLLAILLAAAAGLSRSGFPVSGGLVLAVGMGLENTVFNRPGFSGVGLTYMTGTLVRIGQRVAEALGSGPWSAVVPDLLLWLGMVVGASLGVVAFHHLGLDGLWCAAASVPLLAGLALWAVRTTAPKPAQHKEA